jgi:hypothetical protein
MYHLCETQSKVGSKASKQVDNIYERVDFSYKWRNQNKNPHLQLLELKNVRTLKMN